jgi:hypothetical protein
VSGWGLIRLDFCLRVWRGREGMLYDKKKEGVEEIKDIERGEL